MLSTYTVRKALGQRIQRARLRNRDFTLISNDCWGAEMYKFLGCEGYNTPFIGLYLLADDYLQFLTKPQHYLASPLEFIERSRHESVNQSRLNKAFPIGLLGGEVEVQFLHYASTEEARQKWERRVKRVNWNNLCVKWDAAKDGATAEHIQAFRKLPFKKLLLLKEPQPAGRSAVVVPNYSPDGKQNFNLSMAAFDVVAWANSGKVGQG